MESIVKGIEIRPANYNDEIAWKAMWADYNSFYGVIVPENITESTWARIINTSSSICALIAVDNSEIIGFANYVLHEYTWSEGLACLMDDLFVIPKKRGRGASKLMIQRLINIGLENNWTRVYWMTRIGNTTARSVYDKFCRADGFVRYTMPLDGITPTAGNSE
ncbi:GNAT family N-acetyltransferase [Clostridium estertheticum]|uniref:GNAT family N-acetyltransferase n=1 Tax=Clostridium estertheticum TaxID=238834 RepID=A0AA47EMN2_9CLOT|nr:GNAT family N-acetyltransferase [Clostridium estertheticum]MBU3154058.1 GNAT family N-acetyltransferase [Clostridium estertheticum]MBU3199782.1 GNAT family N-acetyltransferase [Clostridium estertheticum]WAG62925.1 GNAT family N-acetyltransferase [Clostridium estertheticum]WAG67566.1 GNAT family N-acetyltransferase [Clostridium estertheticum]